ncbi:MAG: hypothetical protein JNL70_10590 [Saprospiraceae bacterium]|nr:hypothetical protein [Saprospiraceae bacterium]
MYDKYYGKHWVRKEGWLPSGKAFAAKYRKKYLKYLTLCAENAIDIFLFEKEGLLHRNKNSELQDVIICEKDVSAAQRIFALVRPPLKEAVFIGKLESILNFEEDHHTRGIDPDDDTINQRNSQIRQKFKYKKDHLRLLHEFPFDLINFDIVENMLRNTETPLLRSLQKIFEFQQDTNFLLFVTIPIEDINASFYALFKERMQENIDSHIEIKQAFEERFDIDADFDSIDQKCKITIGFAKQIIIPYADQYNWQCRHHGTFIYENNRGRRMLNTIVELSKNQAENHYVRDVVNIIKNMPHFMPYQENYPTEIVEDLEAIIEYRERIRNENT